MKTPIRSSYEGTVRQGSLIISGMPQSYNGNYFAEQRSITDRMHVALFPQSGLDGFIAWLEARLDGNKTLAEFVATGNGIVAKMPAAYLGYLRLREDSRVVLVGDINHFELWNAREFRDFNDSISEQELLELLGANYLTV